MSVKALNDILQHSQMLKPVAVTANNTSSVLDLADQEWVEIVINPGLWTDGTFTPVLQDSSDNTNFASVTSSYLNGSFAGFSGTAAAVIQKIGYVGPNRYLRVVTTVAGTTTGAILSILGITKPRKLPPSVT